MTHGKGERRQMPHFEVSEIHAIRADAEKFREDDIVRLCDFTLEILGPCCTTPATCERECIYRWKHVAADREQMRAALERLDSVLDFSEPETIETFEPPKDLSALKEAFGMAYDALYAKEPK